MSSKEENELLTQSGPGTPCGNFMRYYWQPVALSEELGTDAPLKVKVLGEELVLFRDDQGRLGAVGVNCPHRGADLSLGRIEDGGLRCIYHGWLFDIHGRCLDQPGEPPDSEFKNKVKHRAYPCQEVAGIIFGYLGRGKPPLLPEYEPFMAPAEHTYTTKTFHECNYLQGNEGNIDPVHLSFLHRRMKNIHHQPVKGTDGVHPMALLTGDHAPIIEVEETDFGVRIFTVRRAGEDRNYLRVTNFVLQNLSMIAGPTAGDGYNIHWHVPIDDTHHWRYDIIFRDSIPLDAEDLKKINTERSEKTPDYRWVRNKANHWLQDRESMKTWNFSGIGSINNAQDTAIVESAGPIQDHTQEHLGTTDKAIIAARRLLLNAIGEVQAGHEPPHVIRERSKGRLSHLVVMSEVIPASEDWRSYWKKTAGLSGKLEKDH